jgi:iron complex outermembrane receptor protein
VSASGPLTPHLTLLGGFMLLDAVQERTGVPATEGRKVLGTPDFTLPLYLIYRLPDAPGSRGSGPLSMAGHAQDDGCFIASVIAAPQWSYCMACRSG